MPSDENAEVTKRLRELLGRPDPVGFTRHGIAPGAFSYVTRDDRLYLRSRNSVTGAVVRLSGRLHQPDGHIHEFTYLHTPATDRSVSLESFDIGEGYIVGLAVDVASGTVRRGHCFIELGLLRGLTAAASVRQVLGRDYVTDGDGWGWPGAPIKSSLHGPGILRSITGTDPAVDTEISEAVPTNARWLVRSVRFTLVTDANAATRRVHLVIDDGTTTLLDIGAGGTQTASVTKSYNAFPEGPSATSVTAEVYLTLPGNLMLLQGFQLLTATQFLQATDNFGAPQLYVEEWLEE